jgi:hypothetical protein
MQKKSDRQTDRQTIFCFTQKPEEYQKKISAAEVLEDVCCRSIRRCLLLRRIRLWNPTRDKQQAQATFAAEKKKSGLRAWVS